MKPKKCKDCKLEFTPFKFAQPRCMSCALLLAKSKREAKVNRDRIALQLEEKAKHKIAKDNILRVKDVKPVAQNKYFNVFIRKRDSGLPCISCGRYEQEIINSGVSFRFGVWDAGHYLSRGSHPWLAFNEDNCHAQCKHCNGGSKSESIKKATVAKAYRENLIKKIGIERVEALENNHDNKRKLTVDDYKQIIAEYKIKIKQLGE